MRPIIGRRDRLNTLARLYNLISKAREDNNLWVLMAFFLAVILLASVIRH